MLLCLLKYIEMTDAIIIEVLYDSVPHLWINEVQKLLHHGMHLAWVIQLFQVSHDIHLLLRRDLVYVQTKVDIVEQVLYLRILIFDFLHLGWDSTHDKEHNDCTQY